MILTVTAEHIAAARPGRTDPLELAAKAAGVKLSAGRSRIIIEHGYQNRAGVFEPPAWWSVQWTRFHASGQMEWTRDGWASRGGERVEIAPYTLEVPAAALVVEPRHEPPQKRKPMAIGVPR